MERLQDEANFKRIRNRYRLVIMNDDTFEEVIRFKLTRLSVYLVLSTIFTVLVGLTLALISFTNLKFLIPGYGKQSSLEELRTLKMQTDSLERVITLQSNYLNSIRGVLQGDTTLLKKDTLVLQDTTLQIDTN